MSYEGSLLHLKNWSAEKFYSLFESIKNNKDSFSLGKKSTFLVFFEPSTRTRFSFELACHRVGSAVSVFSSDSSTSVAKGETLLDTLENLEAMRPDLIVLRAPAHFDFFNWEKSVKTPVINAGWGSFGHPTQALLDLFTLYETNKDLSQLKILIVGDIKHSRVAQSHFEAANILGIQLGVCGPRELIPSDLPSGIQIFQNLKDGMKWAQVLMALRIQKERHTNNLSYEDLSGYLIDEEKIQKWGQHLMVMHPGPVNYGVEIDRVVARSKNSLILKQVENGVRVRTAILKEILSQKGNS